MLPKCPHSPSEEDAAEAYSNPSPLSLAHSPPSALHLSPKGQLLPEAGLSPNRKGWTVLSLPELSMVGQSSRDQSKHRPRAQSGQ